MTELSLKTLADGGKPALSRALAALERTPEAPASIALLDAAYAAAKGHVIGVTGPPGVGKSTLIGTLIRAWRSGGRRVAVIAVDPSSRRTGGALLGDRTRFDADPDDDGVFVRSMAARDRLGGLAEATLAAMVVMRALYDLVVVETVGVGQSEADIAGLADTVVFCVQPGSGDSLQFMKAGIVEIPHIAVVTKADVGAAAGRALADLKGALSLAVPNGEAWPLRALKLSARNPDDVATLIEAIDAHWAWLGGDGRLAASRQVQAETWLREAVRARFGREGLRRAGRLDLPPGASPFQRLAEVHQSLGGESP